MGLKSDKNTGMFYLKVGLLLFWGCWFALACTTNIFDFINAFGGLPADWRFRSGNYVLVGGTLDIFHLGRMVLNILFTGVILIQACSATFFLLAFAAFWRQEQRRWQWVNRAFTLSIALWAMFLVSEELLIAYGFEGTHTGLLVAEVVTLLALYLLP